MKVKNNSELVKAVRNLSDSENRYIIVFDNAFDNIQVIRGGNCFGTLLDEKTMFMSLGSFASNIYCWSSKTIELDLCTCR